MNSEQAEQVVEEQAQLFEEHKGYLIRLWDDGQPSAPNINL
jgi:hypothetical protein